MTSNTVGNRPGVSSDVQERTLKVTNIPEKVTKNLLFELFTQCGPVRNVVLKPDFAFIEFDSEISVGYALALMDGVQLYGQRLELQPKITKSDTFLYVQRLDEYERTFATQPHNWWARFGKNDGRPMPPHICSSVLNKMNHDVPYVPLPDIYRSSGSLVNQPQNDSSLPSRRGNQSHNYNSPSSSNFHISHHQQQQHNPYLSRSYQSIHSQSPSVYDIPSRESSRSSDHFDNRRREESSSRNSDTHGYGGRTEIEHRRDDEAYYRRRQRDFDDGGYHRPDRRTDHSTYERYNPYSRQDHRQPYHQQNQFRPQDPYHHQPNYQQQSTFQDDRRNSFPTYRDNRFSRPPHHSRY